MFCKVTGIETDNKWNNQPIHPTALFFSKRMHANNPHISVRDCLIHMTKKCKKALKPSIWSFFLDYTDSEKREIVVKVLALESQLRR